MTTVAGGNTAAAMAADVASSFEKNKSKVETIKPVATSMPERTKGSVFNGAGKFGAVSHLAKAGITPQAPKPKAKDRKIGNLLAGNFGSLTAKRNNSPSSLGAASIGISDADNDRLTQLSDDKKWEKELGLEVYNVA